MRNIFACWLSLVCFIWVISSSITFTECNEFVSLLTSLKSNSPFK
jgi:hypothetical protein